MPRNDFAFFLNILDEPLSIPLDPKQQQQTATNNDDNDDYSDDDNLPRNNKQGNNNHAIYNTLWFGIFNRSHCLRHHFLHKPNNYNLSTYHYQGHESLLWDIGIISFAIGVIQMLILSHSHFLFFQVVVWLVSKILLFRNMIIYSGKELK
jgi:hypothetical protein